MRFETSVVRGVALALIFAAAPVFAVEPSTEPARVVIQQAVAGVLGALREEGLSTDERRARIEKIALDRFDFVAMSKMVLGRNRRSFSATQQARFAGQFRVYLANQYGHRIEGYDQETVEVLGTRQEKAFRGQTQGDVTVFTKVVGGEFDGATLDYRMRRGDDTWRVIDLIIEGVSLVSNYRDQFGEIISRKGADGLLAQLEAKNEAPDP